MTPEQERRPGQGAPRSASRASLHRNTRSIAEGANWLNGRIGHRGGGAR